jgi:hypothetical protein
MPNRFYTIASRMKNKTESDTMFDCYDWRVRKLTGDNLKVVLAEFSTLS